MTAGPLITVHDRTSFTAHVSPEQAAAYARGKLPGWKERVTRRDGDPLWILFACDGHEIVMVPAMSSYGDYSRRMVELVDALVSLGCAQQPSQVLAAMAAIHCERTAPDGDGCWLGPRHAGECRSHAEMGERGEVEP